MAYLKKIGLILLIVTALSSCGNRNVIFDESVVLPNASWDNEEFARFDVNVEDTLSAYNFYLNIRHLENYRYSNFYMFMHTTFPDGSQTHDTVEIVLAYPDGRWIGDGSGSMRVRAGGCYPLFHLWVPPKSHSRNQPNTSIQNALSAHQMQKSHQNT